MGKENVMNALFNVDELEVLKHVMPDGIDIAALKKLGTVNVEEMDHDTSVTKVINFKSSDGAITFSKSHTYSKKKTIDHRRIKELRKLLEKAVDEDSVDGYLRAQKIKDTLDTILFTL